MTDVPLREYIEKQIAALDKAVEKAERQLDTRMLVTKSEHQSAMEGVIFRIRQLELDAATHASAAKEAGRMAGILSAIVASILVGVLVGVITNWLSK